MIPAYAEIAVTTNFSFLRGASHPREFAAAATLYGLAAIGVADLITDLTQTGSTSPISEPIASERALFALKGRDSMIPNANGIAAPSPGLAQPWVIAGAGP